MPYINRHPAPGLGELMPGWHVVPQNPIAPDYTELVPTPQARSGGRPVYVPHIGELMPGRFVEPENPIRKAMGMGSCGGCAGCGSCGHYGPARCQEGCGCPSAIGFSGLGGLGDLSSVMDTLTTGYMPYLIGGGLVLWFLSGRGSDYSRAKSELRRKYPSRYRRARRAVAAGAEAF